MTLCDVLCLSVVYERHNGGHAIQGFVRASDGLSSISGKLNDLIAQLVRAQRVGA